MIQKYMEYFDRIINIAVDGMNILEVPKTKFLGFVINQTLPWNCHKMIIKQKIAKNVGILYRVCYFIPRCITFIVSHINRTAFDVLQYCLGNP
jgi:hypothetical protein